MNESQPKLDIQPWMIFAAFWGMEYWKNKSCNQQSQLLALDNVLKIICEKYSIDSEDVRRYCEAVPFEQLAKEETVYPAVEYQAALQKDLEDILASQGLRPLPLAKRNAAGFSVVPKKL